MFTLTTMTKVRVLDVRVLSRKNRKPDELPGCQLLLQATLGASALAMFDGYLPAMMYRRAENKPQSEIDGLETAELTSVGEHVKRLPWVYEQTGCSILIDSGIGGPSNIVLVDVMVHRVSIRPEQKGVVVQWAADIPGLDDKTRGRLTGIKSTDVQMTLDGPEVDDGQGQIPGTEKKPEAAAPAPQPDAGDTFAAASGTNGATGETKGAESGTRGPEDETRDDDGSGHPDAGKGDDQMGKDWPFPGDPAGHPQAPAADVAPAVAAKTSRRSRKADAVGEVH